MVGTISMSVVALSTILKTVPGTATDNFGKLGLPHKEDNLLNTFSQQKDR